MYTINIKLFHNFELDFYDYGRYDWRSDLKESIEVKRNELPKIMYFRRKLRQLGLPKHTKICVWREPYVLHFYSKKFGQKKEYATVYFEEFKPKGVKE